MDEKQKSVIQAYNKAQEKMNEISIEGILFLIFLILTVIFIVFIVNYISRRSKLLNKKREFWNYLKGKNLSDEQIKILWDYSEIIGRDPFIAIENKPAFEKIIDIYEKRNPNYDEELIQDMREKLGFYNVMEYIPIVTTKEIETYTKAKLIFEGITNEIYLVDKDEKYMYWLLPNKNLYIQNGDEVQILLTREKDAVYYIKEKIENIEETPEGILLKMHHTFNFERKQRREFPRFEIEIDAILARTIKENNKVFTQWIGGKIQDISPGGVRFCLTEKSKRLPIGTQALIKFELSGKEINEKVEVVNIFEKEDIICFGMKFIDMKEERQRFIHNYINKKLSNLYNQIRGKNEDQENLNIEIENELNKLNIENSKQD